MAFVGYCCGLIQGEGMQFALALWAGAIGGFVVLLGYGPIAVVVGFLGAWADWFQGDKEKQNCEQRSDSNDHADSVGLQPTRASGARSRTSQRQRE
jgi:hypothetical protein